MHEREVFHSVNRCWRSVDRPVAYKWLKKKMMLMMKSLLSQKNQALPLVQCAVFVEGGLMNGRFSFSDGKRNRMRDSTVGSLSTAMYAFIGCCYRRQRRCGWECIAVVDRATLLSFEYPYFYFTRINISGSQKYVTWQL